MYTYIDVDFRWMEGPSKKYMNVSCDEKMNDNQESFFHLKHPKKIDRDCQQSFYGLNRRTTETKTSSLVHLFRFWINTAILDDAIPVG